MYLVFARKYRPHTFEDVVGQDHIARTLKNAVRNNRVAHAYLFCGSRGVGKTSMARILAAALNCKDGPTENPCGECEHCRRIAVGDDLDVMEIDGASNRGIDEVRELRQNSKISPSHSQFKIYYIDEVHMLTQQAFNALLKTLEEPPEHVKFIFSTTDPQQLPDTVKSRCQRFDFRRISDAEIVKHLQKICENEGLTPENGALPAIARAARGGMRDALGTLDQVTAFSESEVKLDDVLTVLGAARTQTLIELVDSLASADTAKALQQVHEVLFGGIDMLDFIDQFSEYLRDILVAKYCKSGDELLAGAIADNETLKKQAGLFTAEQLLYMLQIVREARLRSRRDTTGKLALELAIIKLSRLDELIDLSAALESEEVKKTSTAQRPSSPRESSRDRVRDPKQTGGGGDTSSQSRDNNHSQTRIKNMMRRLKNRNAEPEAGTETKKKDIIPENIAKILAPKKYRELQSAAENPSVGRELADSNRLLEAFARGNQKFNLQPVVLKKSKEGS